MLRNVEQVAIGIHPTALGIGGFRRSLSWFGQSMGDDIIPKRIGVLDRNSKMIEPWRRFFGAGLQEGYREVAIGNIIASALLMNDGQAKNLLVEFGEPLWVGGLERKVPDFNHFAPSFWNSRIFPLAFSHY